MSNLFDDIINMTDDYQHRLAARNRLRAVTIEKRQKVSKRMKTWWDDNPEKKIELARRIQKQRENNGGSLFPEDYVVSDETKQKISKKLSGRTLSSEHVEKLKVPCSEQSKTKKSVALKAFHLDPKNKVTCVHCKLVVPISTIKSIHGDNCTLKDYSIVARDLKGNICNIYSDYASLIADGVSYYHLTSCVLTNKKTNKYHAVFWTKEKTKQIKKVKVTAIVYKRNLQVILTCPHCSKQGGASNMKRFHMDNCKSKSKQDA